jgi:hypothetical protein
MTRLSLFPVGRWLEPLFAAAVVVMNVYVLWYLYTYSYLPQPFFFQPDDTWMDWFNTAYWAHSPGAYDSWRTIYPPLSFVVLQPITWGACYAGAEGPAARACDVYGAVSLHAIFLINLVLIFFAFRKLDRATMWPRTLALGLGLPMTYALERGNVLLICFTCVLLGFGPLIRSVRWRWFFVGCAVNFKVYLIGTVFAQLLHRRWRWFEGALIATVLVYLVSLAIKGEGLPWEVYENIRDYSTGFQAASPLDLWYTITYLPLLSLVDGNGFPAVAVLGSEIGETLRIVIPAMIRTVQATIAIAAVAAFLRPRVVPMNRLVFLAIAIALVGSEAGGYTQMFLMLFVFFERSRTFGVKLAVILVYILCIPFDIVISDLPERATNGFLGIREVIARFGVGLMHVLRPGLVLLLCWTMALDTLVRLWRAKRELGPVGNLRDFISFGRTPAVA